MTTSLSSVGNPTKGTTVKMKPSVLLSQEENETVFKLLGHRCQTLATAVVQVYLSEPPSHNKWNKRYCGVVCFVRDCLRQAYFIRVFCIDQHIVLWEQELYTKFKYRAPRPYFHTFEAEDCQAGLNFADDTEAANFKNAIEEKLRQKEERHMRKRQHLRSSSVPNGSVGNVTSSPNLIHKQNEKRKRKDKNRKLTKADIGIPTDFKHVSHIGWNLKKGLDVETVDPELQHFFNIAGVSEHQLKDKDTRDFIYDFIDQHGGVAAAVRDVAANETNLGKLHPVQPPPVPARQPPTPQAARALPPTPPSRATAPLPPLPPSSVPPPPPSRSPHPHRNKSQLSRPPPTVPPLPIDEASTRIPPPPPMPPVGGPPPPPPPMPPSGISPPPPVPPPGGPQSLSVHPADGPLPGHQNAHSALLESIRGGKTLRHVEDEPRRGGGDSRGNLLNEIRTGIQLKPVEEQTHAPPAATESLGLAGALARALANRSLAIHSSDDSDEDTDDEWED